MWQRQSLCRFYTHPAAALSNLHADEAPNGAIVNTITECAMNDLLFLLLGIGGIAAMFGYAAFCNRH